MSRRLLHAGLTVVVLANVSHAAVAQDEPSPSQDVPNVFFDCQTYLCDYDHTRREIPYVNWVRDRQDAEIHVLITALQTGGGGWEFTVEFIGLERFANLRDTLRYTSRNTDTQDEIRNGLTRIVRLGLVPFLTATSVADRLDVTYAPLAEAAATVAATAEDDPWNFWTFELSANGFGNGESQQRFFDGGASVEANRTTDALKLNFDLSGFGSRQEFDVVDTALGLDTTYVSTQTSYRFDALAAMSLADHWSAGLRANMSRSSRLNQDLAIRAGPAIEYNLYPYDESTRRQITFEYSVGIAAFNYNELTVYDRLSEVHPTHTLRIGTRVTQPWGSVNLSLTGTQFLHDLAKHNVGLFGSVRIRIFRGLSFNVGGSISRIKDQLYISQVGLTPAEVLLEIRNRQTDFRYFGSVGLSFRFGSKFANVVNTRLGGGGGIMIF